MRLLMCLVVALLAAAPAAASTAAKPWPPREGPGQLFVHYGEEHWNDIDGEAVLTQVVADTIRFKPDLVTMSGDKDNDGTVEQLEKWRSIMDAYDRAGIPYMAGVGNHDGKQATPEPITDAAAGSTPLRDITNYLQVFAGRPYPFGDAAPYANASMGPAARPPDDPQGASTHYYVDFANTRFVFMDSSCYGILNCDPLQNPPDGRGRSQYQFLRDAAAEANSKGMVIFVVTHMPTRDPRDQDHSTAIQRAHVMGKGASPDNGLLELEAMNAGVDAVLVAHIKGQWQYRGRGDVPYYIDGGAGGELYTAGPRGVDHGYWYGWRMLRVDKTVISTDVVPVISPDGISLDGPARMAVGEQPVTWEAFARQPATKSERGVVPRLELRDPDPVPKSGQALLIPWELISWLAPLALLALLAAARAPRPRRAVAGAVGLALVGSVAVASAQRSEPTATPKESLPNPARIFTTSDPLVLAPVASSTDDARRSPSTQTADGSFQPVCPGRANVTVTSGFEEASAPVLVKSAPGSIVRSARARSSVRRGRGLKPVATVKLAQQAILSASLKRGKRVVGRIAPSCQTKGTKTLRLPLTKRGRYRLELRVRSDRKTLVRRYRVRAR